jgi:8-oxo-dGTP pyrophosphatase MutT (NUDIX family)
MPMSAYMSRLREKIGKDLLQVPSVTVISLDHRGRVLLVKHADTGMWVAPGGSVEPLETPADAAVREMWEETGLLVEPSRVLGVYGGPEFHVVYRNGDQVSYVMTVFECRVVGGELRTDGIETSDVAHFSPAHLATLELAPWVRPVLADAFEGRPGAAFQSGVWRPPTNAAQL